MAFFQSENRFQLTKHELAFKYATGNPLFHFFDCYKIRALWHNIQEMSDIVRSEGFYGRHCDVRQKKWQKSVLLGKRPLPPVDLPPWVQATSSQERLPPPIIPHEHCALNSMRIIL